MIKENYKVLKRVILVYGSIEPALRGTSNRPELGQSKWWYLWIKSHILKEISSNPH